VDLSALIFVALAAAWAAYLIPKALRHHADDERNRTVDRFSDSVRVVARREPVDSKSTRLVAERPTSEAREPVERRRATSAHAARRRRRVLLLLLLANVAVGALVAFEVVALQYVAVPAALLVLWLVVCRLTTRAERARLTAPPATHPAADSEDEPGGDATEEVPVVTAAVAGDESERIADAPGTWDPVPVTLPTYVDKEASRRSVRTIDLDSTGVWTSGHSEADAELARRAEQEATETERPGDADEATRRVSGA
jgi:hypothetical protein